MQCINNLEIGARLGRLRIQKGIKEVDVSVELEISTAQYSRLEQGKSQLTVEALQKVCGYYRTTAEYVLFGQEEPRDSIFYQRLKNYSEHSQRKSLKILSCILLTNNDPGYLDNPTYRIFMMGLLEKIPEDALSTISVVLEYERNRRKLSENAMIRELNISRFKWDSIMKKGSVRDLRIPLTIHDLYGYELDFLINNRISGSLFFDNLISKEPEEKQKKILQVFDSILNIHEEDYLLEVQKNRTDRGMIGVEKLYGN